MSMAFPAMYRRLYSAFLVCGIYVSFLTWAVLQERIATTPYGVDGEIFRGALFLNTCQSCMATGVAFVYLLARGRATDVGGRLPGRRLFVVALSSSLASPFGYASLRHLDYPTLILGKSSKLLSVMIIHIVLYRSQFPGHKYLAVVLISIGVALFTFHPGAGAGAAAPASASMHGLALLGVNLLLDGYTNSTQDIIFKQTPQLTGPDMMFGLNAIATLLTSCCLLATQQGHLALSFISQYPAIVRDIALFSLCGAVGQIFIFSTLEYFGSLTLVTITLTRKIGTMIISVIWFKHHLRPSQLAGIILVFLGIGLETFWTRRKIKT